MPPLHHISLSPFSSSYLVLHTPLPPITLFLLFAQPFQLSSVPGLDWSSPFIYPLPCTGISSVRHLFVLILRPPLLIFSSTHPRIILFSILPCARPLNRNEPGTAFYTRSWLPCREHRTPFFFFSNFSFCYNCLPWYLFLSLHDLRTKRVFFLILFFFSRSL